MIDKAESKTGEQRAVEPSDNPKSRGCGAWIAYCGHTGASDQKPTTLSGNCMSCGRKYTVTCSDKDCAGRDFYC